MSNCPSGFDVLASLLANIFPRLPGNQLGRFGGDVLVLLMD
jgi:hypothetical protein